MLELTINTNNINKIANDVINFLCKITQFDNTVKSNIKNSLICYSNDWIHELVKFKQQINVFQNDNTLINQALIKRLMSKIKTELADQQGIDSEFKNKQYENLEQFMEGISELLDQKLRGAVEQDNLGRINDIQIAQIFIVEQGKQQSQIFYNQIKQQLILLSNGKTKDFEKFLKEIKENLSNYLESFKTVLLENKTKYKEYINLMQHLQEKEKQLKHEIETMLNEYTKLDYEIETNPINDDSKKKKQEELDQLGLQLDKLEELLEETKTDSILCQHELDETIPIIVSGDLYIPSLENAFTQISNAQTKLAKTTLTPEVKIDFLNKFLNLMILEQVISTDQSSLLIEIQRISRHSNFFSLENQEQNKTNAKFISKTLDIDDTDDLNKLKINIIKATLNKYFKAIDDVVSIQAINSLQNIVDSMSDELNETKTITNLEVILPDSMKQLQDLLQHLQTLTKQESEFILKHQENDDIEKIVSQIINIPFPLEGRIREFFLNQIYPELPIITSKFSQITDTKQAARNVITAETKYFTPKLIIAAKKYKSNFINSLEEGNPAKATEATKKLEVQIENAPLDAVTGAMQIALGNQEITSHQKAMIFLGDNQQEGHTQIANMDLLALNMLSLVKQISQANIDPQVDKHIRHAIITKLSNDLQHQLAQLKTMEGPSFL